MERPTFTAPEEVVREAQEIADSDREAFMVIYVDARNKMINREIISVGTLNAALVHPREVFKGAILKNAHAIIIVHNHPSGDPSPSKDDRLLTERLADAGKLLGIEVLDHIIVTPGRGWISFKQAELF